MPGGGLMQLVAYGAQNVYITGAPVTFYRVTYRRHTNFAMESIDFNEDNRDPPQIQLPELIIKYLQLDPVGGNNQCVISLEPIQENDEYWQCNTCTKVVSWEAAGLWIGQHKTCPHCRQVAGLDTKFVNGLQPPTEF